MKQPGRHRPRSHPEASVAPVAAGRTAPIGQRKAERVVGASLAWKSAPSQIFNFSCSTGIVGISKEVDTCNAEIKLPANTNNRTRQAMMQKSG